MINGELKIIIEVITLTLRPCLSADMWKTLKAPVNWICLVWGEAVPIYQAGVVLLWKKNRELGHWTLLKLHLVLMAQDNGNSYFNCMYICTERTSKKTAIINTCSFELFLFSPFF